MTSFSSPWNNPEKPKEKKIQNEEQINLQVLTNGLMYTFLEY